MGGTLLRMAYLVCGMTNTSTVKQHFHEEMKDFHFHEEMKILLLQKQDLNMLPIPHHSTQIKTKGNKRTLIVFQTSTLCWSQASQGGHLNTNGSL